MLVLSRRINESIQIGTDIEIMVIDVRGEVVRLGITAPQSTQIWRKELWDIIVKENKTAAGAGKVSENLPLSDSPRERIMKTTAIILGSDSDLPIAEKSIDVLRKLGLPFTVHVISAHRTPEQARDFARSAASNGYGAIIAIGCALGRSLGLTHEASSYRSACEVAGLRRA